MLSLLPLLPLLAQVGPSSALPSMNRSYPSQLPLEIIEKKDDEARRRAAQEAENDVQVQPFARNGAGCMGAVASNPETAARLSREALSGALGRERVRAGLCLGVALSELGRWDEASQAFASARDAADAQDHLSRARLGAMAGNAALAAGQPGQALAVLAPAATDAGLADAKDLVASIALDRARGLVGVGQNDQAARALAEARAAEPENAQAWLLSATLARRQEKFAEAQAHIEKAAALAPQDPEVGLEAGVIAMLSGNEAAARRSWTSVEASAPGSEAARTAKDYLAQLAPESAPQDDAAKTAKP